MAHWTLKASSVSKMNYRRDIDGLRAVAVLPVILFHSGLSSFRGGFIGVDVFFVISGYLITSIIIRDVEAGTFRFHEFYERRARRILPALFLVLFCCVPFAWMWMTPLELKAFSGTLASVVLFVSNLSLWQQSGYFDPSGELNPLLHTWSLAVEEQYYIVFPISVLILWRLGRKNVIRMIVLVALMSLVISEYASRYYPSASFYLLPTRAWELMAGALCSFAITKSHLLRNNVLSAAGLAAIVVSILAYDKATPFPSVYALLPVLGTCAILLFATEGTLVRRVLSVRPLVGLGLVSYSAYLWHQPLFAFARMRSVSDPKWQLMLLLAATSILLAYFSWRFIELPARKMVGASRPKWQSVLLALGLAGVAITGVGLLGHLGGGFPNRMTSSALEILESSSDVGRFRNECLGRQSLDLVHVQKKCQLGIEGDKIDFLLFGDSHAVALADGLDVAAKKSHQRGLLFGLHACPPVISIGGTWNHTKAYCKIFQNSILGIVNDLKPKIVILNAAWLQLDDKILIRENGTDASSGYDAFHASVIDTLNAINNTGATVYVVCCTPRAIDGLDIPASQAKIQLYGSNEDIRQSRDQFRFANRTAFAIFQSPEFRRHATLIDLTDEFCSKGKCELFHGRRALFFDMQHLTKYGSENLSPILERILTPLKFTDPTAN